MNTIYLEDIIWAIGILVFVVGIIMLLLYIQLQKRKNN